MIFDRVFKLSDEQALSIVVIDILVKFLIYSLEWMLVCIYQLLLVVLYYYAHFLSKFIFYLRTNIVLYILRFLISFLIRLRSWSNKIFLNFLIMNICMNLFLWAFQCLIFSKTHINFITLFGWIWTFITYLTIKISISRNKPFKYKIIKICSIYSFILRI